jgi:hypothetical protein
MLPGPLKEVGKRDTNKSSNQYPGWFDNFHFALNNSCSSLPTVIPFSNISMLAFLRVQKTGSKTLVNLLEHNSWPPLRSTCVNTGWVGQTTSTCYHLTTKALKYRIGTSRIGHGWSVVGRSATPISGSNYMSTAAAAAAAAKKSATAATLTGSVPVVPQSPLPCLIDGHCGMDVLIASFMNAANITLGKRPFIITMMRSPAPRAFSE